MLKLSQSKKACKCMATLLCAAERSSWSPSQALVRTCWEQLVSGLAGGEQVGTLTMHVGLADSMWYGQTISMSPAQARFVVPS